MFNVQGSKFNVQRSRFNVENPKSIRFNPAKGRPIRNPQSAIRNLKSLAGVTILETIMFIVVAGIFVPLSYIAFSSAIQSGGTPETVTTARFLAEQKMEELTSYAFDNVPASGSDTVGNYSRTWAVDALSAGDINASPPIQDYSNYKKIVINVSGSGVGDYTVYTIVTKRPQ